MNENINLYEILKDCPKNTEFYCSEIDQNVKFMGIEDSGFEGIVFMVYDSYSMINSDCVHYIICTNRYGSIFRKGKTPIIFPSKEQRDWSKFKVKKPKFDPKTFKPFDRVLVRYTSDKTWDCALFSHSGDFKFYTEAGAYRYCIPYNDDTKHLVGTTEEASEYYRYWED